MLKFIAKQFRNPRGFMGRIVSGIMEKGNKGTYDWMLSIMDINDGDAVLEIGYGTGQVISRIAGSKKKTIIRGIDFSKVMHEKAVMNNRTYIEEGRAVLSYGDLLGYKSDIKFSKVFGINVIYFWDDLPKYFNKLSDLMDNGGTLYIYMSDADSLGKIPFTRNEVFNKYGPKEVSDKLGKAGFHRARYLVNEEELGRSYCIIAEKK
jgi:SAM-dependent methyltransferase